MEREAFAPLSIQPAERPRYENSVRPRDFVTGPFSEIISSIVCLDLVKVAFFLAKRVNVIG